MNANNNDIQEGDAALQVDFSTWDQFLRILPKLHYGDWLFRGQKSEKWKLRSGLDREREERKSNRQNWDRSYKMLPKDNGTVFMTGTSFISALLSLPNTHAEERVAIEYYIRYSATAFEGKLKNIQALSEMQHYGAKTRLLDFSESVFVALFFAFESRTSPDKRVVYAINRSTLFANSKLLLNSVDCRNPITEDGSELECNSHAREEELAIHAAEKNIAETDDLKLGVLPVFLRGSNKRLAAQNGCFLFPLSFEPFDDNLAKAFSTTSSELAKPSKRLNGQRAIQKYDFSSVSVLKFVFAHQMEDEAWDILNHANITPRTIYPDINGLAKSVRYD
jgi:hypothetical protein